MSSLILQNFQFLLNDKLIIIEQKKNEALGTMPNKLILQNKTKKNPWNLITHKCNRNEQYNCMVNAVSEIIQCRLIRRVEFQVFDLKFPVLA